jgi:hypothetical protein
MSNKIDSKNIEDLLAQKKYDEVRAIISASIHEKFTDKERGESLVAIASIYMDISNSINEAYRDALKEAIAGIGQINKAESHFKDNVKLEEVRSKLNN